MNYEVEFSKNNEECESEGQLCIASFEMQYLDCDKRNENVTTTVL